MPPERLLRIAELGTVEYQRALDVQNALVAARVSDRIGDTLLLLEHPHVYTLGRGADDRFIREAIPGIPIVRVSRGGQVTYHGPQQLVGYPILKLDGDDRDVTRYLRRLEQAMIKALAEFGVSASRRERFTGVWVDGRKIASIGVGIRRWVTYHGFAINLSTDLRYFDSIVPCGIDGCEMTSLAALGCADVDVQHFAQIQSDAFAEVFGYSEVQTIEPAAIWQQMEPRSESPASVSV